MARIACAMREVDVYKVDAFTNAPFQGNPAGVVPDATGLTPRQMQAVAREMNLSETAFVLPPTKEGARFRLRYFTPTTEIRLCGHATIATFHLLVELGRVRAPTRFALETNAGILPVEVRDGPETFLTADPIATRASPWSAAETARLVGAQAEDVDEKHGGLLVVNDNLFVPLVSPDALARLRPEPLALEIATRTAGLAGVVALVESASSPDARTTIRYFAPALGIPEDPVTGVAHMHLAGWLAHARDESLPFAFIGEQGTHMGRPGRVRVEAEGTREALRVRVGGRAVTVLRGSMRVP